MNDEPAEKIMHTIGGLIDADEGDLWPPLTPILWDVYKAAFGTKKPGTEITKGAMRYLEATGLIETDAKQGLRLTAQGVRYLFERGFLRRYFKRPAAEGQPPEAMTFKVPQ